MSSAASTAPAVGLARTPVLWGLRPLLAKWRGSLALVGFLILAAAAMELVPPLVLRNIVDRHLTVREAGGLREQALLYLLAVAAMQCLTFLYGYVAAAAAQGLLSELRTRLFAHVQRLPSTYFDRVAIGDVISRCTADVDTLDTVFSSGVAVLVANLVRLVTIAAAMVALSLTLSAVAAVVVVPLVIATRVVQRRVRRAERDTRVAVAAVNTRLQEDLRGIEVIRAFGREPEFVGGFRQVLRRGLAASNRSSFYSAFYTPMTALLGATAVAALLAVSTGPEFGATGISLGTLTAFLLLLQRFFQPITALGEEWQTVQGAMAGAERIFDTLALAPDETHDPERRGTSEDRPTTALALDGVHFGYAEGQPVLHGVSLHVAPGEHVALVGRTGAGKSTALQLAAGLYQPWTGRIAVAGKDPTELDDKHRRRTLCVVPQIVQLFSGTVLDNLTLGDPEVAEADVYEAAAIAGADVFIRTLPQGYHTRLSGTVSGGAGTSLSAGQRQLLALARALVHRPAVLLLDEATSAIDNASDAAFRTALRERVLARGVAVLTVAHRLASARDADRVIVLEKGRVVEEGPPSALMASNGRFAAWLELEDAGWDWRTGG